MNFIQVCHQNPLLNQKEDIKNCFLKYIWKDIEKDFVDGLETILNMPYGSSTNTSEYYYDSSSDSYDNTVAEVLLDNVMY